jgi:hypothetical protein
MCQMEPDRATGGLDEDQRAKNRLIVKRCYYKKLVRSRPLRELPNCEFESRGAGRGVVRVVGCCAMADALMMYGVCRIR